MESEKAFPKVYKMGSLLEIVYWDHAELYRFEQTYKNTKQEKYNPWSEIDMIKGNGGKEVHAKEEA